MTRQNNKNGCGLLGVIALMASAKPVSVTVKMGDTSVPATLAYQDGKATVTLADTVTLAAGQSLELAPNREGTVSDEM